MIYLRHHLASMPALVSMIRIADFADALPDGRMMPRRLLEHFAAPGTPAHETHRAASHGFIFPRHSLLVLFASMHVVNTVYFCFLAIFADIAEISIPFKEFAAACSYCAT